MKRSQLEHLIRAAGSIANDDGIVVIGSQSVLGAIVAPPAELVQSMEADIYPLKYPERSELIDGAIGEGSQFHDTFGYYAQGVGPETAILPSSWRTRLHYVGGVQTNGVIGHCLDPHDLALSKYATGRPKDREFVRVMIRQGYLRQDELVRLSEEMPLNPDRRRIIGELIRTDFGQE